VAGVYRLGAVVRGSADGCIYETEFGDDRRPAVIRIAQLDPNEAERSEDRWRNAISLAHPNLLRVYAAGHSVMDDRPVSYVVMERADESLAGVLAERTLSEAEAREMLIPVLGALKYLHRNGYAHSNLSAAKILAVRDVVKVAKDDIQRIGDGGTPAEDMRALGAVVVEALGLEASQFAEDIEGYNPMPSAPFADIVRHCLDPDPNRRWTADQVRERLEPYVDAPVIKEAPRTHDAEEAAGKTPKWIYGGLAALVVVVVLFGLARRETGAGPRAVATATPVYKAPTPPVAPALPEIRIPEQNPVPPANPAPPANSVPPANPVPPVKRKPSSATRGKSLDGWSVIVAAYIAREPAENRRKEMAQRWPSFQWSVFQQQAGKTYYLVVVGQNLSQDQAETLRSRALASGLPHDTYIKKLQ
jgi:serine/threonine protein kinase